jgi:hypothetical protein
MLHWQMLANVPLGLEATCWALVFLDVLLFVNKTCINQCDGEIEMKHRRTERNNAGGIYLVL